MLEKHGTANKGIHVLRIEFDSVLKIDSEMSFLLSNSKGLENQDQCLFTHLIHMDFADAVSCLKGLAGC